MSLSNDLISQFAKATKSVKDKNKEAVVYGTTVSLNDKMYVKIDGSEILTPVVTTSEIKSSERVTVMIKDHYAMITGNISAPSASTDTTDGIKKELSSISAQLGEFELIIADKAEIDDLKAANALIKNLEAAYAEISELVANKASIEDLTATNAIIENLKTEYADIKKLVADKASIKDLEVINGHVQNLISEYATITELVAHKASIDDLKAANANIEKLQATQAQISELVAGKANISDLEAANANITQLQANKADITDLTAAKGEITQLKSETAKIGTLESNIASIDNLLAGNITADNIATGAITAGSGIIANGAIGDAQISSLDAAKISAGTIDTSKVTVAGPNSNLKMSGNRLQVFTGTGVSQVERVSLGDVNGDGTKYGLLIRGADGKTVIMDENGVTNAGITDGSITNDKVNPNANIDGSKLNINSVVSKINEDGTETIQGTKIEVDGTTLNTKLSNITTKQTEDSERITQAQSQITTNTNAIKLKVDEQTYTTDKKDMTTKLEKNTSEITAMKGQIALKVEQTDITTAINNMNIGGRNLLLSSNIVQGNLSGTGGEEIIGDINFFRTKDYIEVSANEDISIKINKIFGNNCKIEKVIAYNGTTYISQHIYHSSSCVLRTPNNCNNIKVVFIIDNGNADTLVKDYKIKIEKGNKFTDFTEAPEDVDIKIDTTTDLAKAMAGGKILYTRSARLFKKGTQWHKNLQ